MLLPNRRWCETSHELDHTAWNPSVDREACWMTVIQPRVFHVVTAILISALDMLPRCCETNKRKVFYFYPNVLAFYLFNPFLFLPWGLFFQFFFFFWRAVENIFPVHFTFVLLHECQMGETLQILDVKSYEFLRNSSQSTQRSWKSEFLL